MLFFVMFEPGMPQRMSFHLKALNLRLSDTIRYSVQYSKFTRHSP